MSKKLQLSRVSFARRPRAFSIVLSVACSLPLSSMIALANVPMHAPVTGAWTSHIPVAPAFHTASQSQSFQAINSGVMHNAIKTLFHANPLPTHSAAAPVNIGASLNLTSSQLNFLAGSLGNFSSLTIDVGGRTEIVNLNTKLTAGEVIAVEQELINGTQSIALSSTGTADGGKVSLNAGLLSALDGALGGSIRSLTIAKGLDVVDNVSSLTLSGSLVNYGTLQAASSTSGSIDTISAGTINNTASGVVGSYTGGSGLNGADVAITATTSLTNVGTISSAHNLTIVAPTVHNAGVISAVGGNVNVISNGALSVTGKGTWQASNGNINFTSANSEINVTGANLLSQQVNFNAGTGNVYANLGQVTGLVNSAGNEISVNANTQNFYLGQVDASGDPLISNQGNIIISNAGGKTDFDVMASNGNPLSIVAQGNITTDGSILTIDTSNASGTVNKGNGGNLTLVAGANFTTSGTGSSAVLKVTGGTTGANAGGTIDLTDGGTNPISITTNSTFAGGSGLKPGNAGNIVMIAYGGSSGAGEVLTSQNAATGISENSTNGKGGSLTVIAGAASGTAISMLAPIDTSGATGGGSLSLSNATPTGTVTFNKSNTVALQGAATGTFKAGALQNGTISTDTITTGGGNLTIAAGTGSTASVTFGAGTDTGTANTGFFPTAFALVGKGLAAGNILVTGNTININGIVESYGEGGANGIAGSTSPGGKVAGGAGSGGGAGGNITMTATDSIQDNNDGSATFGVIQSIGGKGGFGGAGAGTATAAGAGGAGEPVAQPVRLRSLQVL